MSHYLLAQTAEQVLGPVGAPTQLGALTNGTGGQGLSFFITQLIAFFYVIAPVIFLFMIMISAIQWISSGGDKEAVAKARGRITYAVLGLLILGLAFVITRVLLSMFGLSSVFV